MLNKKDNFFSATTTISNNITVRPGLGLMTLGPFAPKPAKYALGPSAVSRFLLVAGTLWLATSISSEWIGGRVVTCPREIRSVRWGTGKRCDDKGRVSEDCLLKQKMNGGIFGYCHMWQPKLRAYIHQHLADLALPT